MLHSLSKVVNECRASGLQAIQGSHNECTLPSVISKFWTKHSPELFSDWCCQVGILNISHLNIQIVQSSQGKCNNHYYFDTTLV
jgi:hypothetical protein